MSTMIQRIRDQRRMTRRDRAVDRAFDTAITRSARAELEFFAQRQIR